MATEKQRWAYLKKTYGLSPETYGKMHVQNKGLCHICDRAPKAGKNHNVDHDHYTGEIRGLLCFFCNKYLIGRRRREHSGLFTRAAAYLWREPKWGRAPVGSIKKKRRNRKR